MIRTRGSNSLAVRCFKICDRQSITFEVPQLVVEEGIIELWTVVDCSSCPDVMLSRALSRELWTPCCLGTTFFIQDSLRKCGGSAGLFDFDSRKRELAVGVVISFTLVRQVIPKS